MKKIISGFILAISILFIANLFFSTASSFEFRETSQRIDKSELVDSFLGIEKAQAESLGGQKSALESSTGIADRLDSNNNASSGNKWVFDVWDFSLSLVNIALIGILIFLGIVNILHLNYDTYQLKKILLPLVIFVILANLSLFICRGIIDFSDALTNTFLKDWSQIASGIKTGVLGNTGIGILGIIFSLGIISAVATGGLAIGPIIGAAILAIIIGLLLIFLPVLIIAVILYIRSFIILLLAAVSPLAFAFGVLPATQGLFKKWWDWFLRWVFMGPVILLLLKIASIIGKSTNEEWNFFGFIGTVGLIIAAIMVPWLLAGSVMGKLQGWAMKGGGWAGKNVPGVSHATAFLGEKGMLGKFKEEREKKLGVAAAAGRGVTMFAQGQGKAAIGEEINYEKQRQANEELNRLVTIKGGVKDIGDDKIKQLMKKNPKTLEQLVSIAGQKGEITNELLVKYKKIAGELGIQEGTKKHDDLAEKVNNAVDHQRIVYRERRNSITNNPFGDSPAELATQYERETNLDARKAKAKKLGNKIVEQNKKAEELKDISPDEYDKIKSEIRVVIEGLGTLDNVDFGGVKDELKRIGEQIKVDSNALKNDSNSPLKEMGLTDQDNIIKLLKNKYNQRNIPQVSYETMTKVNNMKNEIVNIATRDPENRKSSLRILEHNIALIDRAGQTVANQTPSTVTSVTPPPAAPPPIIPPTAP